MPRRDDRVRLKDMLEAIHRIEDYTAGLSLESFAGDQRTIDATIRNLEVLGECRAWTDPAAPRRQSQMPRCSLVGICLPDETRRAMLFPVEPEDAVRQLGLFEDSPVEDEGASLLDGLDPPIESEVRRLVPARDDLRPCM